MRIVTQEDFIRLTEGQNYKVHYGEAAKPYSLNIVGFRGRLSRPDYFDDTIAVYYQSKQKWNSYFFPATTFPGKPYLLKPINPKGTAILQPGQYEYKLGLHKGYQALVQAGPVKVFRDNDKDLVYDLNDSTIDEGFFGINIHKASLSNRMVGFNSAGCQVIKYQSDYAILMGLCRLAAGQGIDKFSYTLVNI